MKEKIKNLRYGIIILITAIIVSIPLCWKNFNYYNDDGIQHIARSFLTMENIKNGESTLVLQRLENGFGYSWDLFYGPLSSFSVAIVGMIFNNIVIGYKLILFLGLLLSGITMFYFVKKITDDRNVGVFASILYMTMPYHLTDMYIRGSIGEFLSFIFIPLIFLGLYNLFHEEKKDWLLVIGAVGAIITHNLMTIIFSIISFIYVAINLPKFKNKKILSKFFINILFIILLSSFFWVPFIENAVNARYQVFEPNMMASPESVQNSGLELKQFVITKNDGSFVFEFGPHILIMLCFSVASFRRILPEMKKEYIFFLVIGILSTFMATKYFPWKFLGEKGAMVQFAWRMLEISCFAFCVVCSINLGIMIKNFKFLDSIVLGIIAILYVVALKEFIPTNDGNFENPKDFNYEFVTGKNTDCMIGMGKNEYLPHNSYKNYFYLAVREKGIVVLDGEISIKNYEKDGNKLKAKIETLKDKTVLELPYLYYSGYDVRADGVKVPFFESNNGFLAIEINSPISFELTVEYTETNLMMISKLISGISLIGFVRIYNIFKV